ncbi:MAG: transglutaminase family protein, partial [Chloroflexi bacterium]|nr:transglutaminase family protein [Chloroflexota bacterium]
MNTFASSRFFKVVAQSLVILIIFTSLPYQAWNEFVGTGVAVAAEAEPRTLLDTLNVDPATKQALAASPQGQSLDAVTFGHTGEPEGMLFDAGAMQAQTAFTPEVSQQPLVVSRVQSATSFMDVTNNRLRVTYMVHNTLSPLVAPEVPENATITETLQVLEGFNLANDPNTIRNVLLETSLTAAATLISAEPTPDQQGTQSAWSLGDIPPGETISVTLELQVGDPGESFVALDSGATVWGTLRGRAVTATTISAVLAPNTFGSWLLRTVDADTQDTYMLDALSVIGGSPQNIFAFVRSLNYESYAGSLRGTRGTLWSGAGNALDQSSLLIAMLRASGIPARYRHGILTEARAQELLASMFPASPGVIGHVPADALRGDPLNDQELLRETRDHWWVEAYLPGQGWQNLDPSFRTASIGEIFVTPDNIASDNTDRIAEIPAEERHTVTVRLRVETYSEFPDITASGGLPISYPLEAVFNTVEMIGEPVSLYHLVEETVKGGLFYVKTIDYHPHLAIGETVIDSGSYQETVSNFPFGTNLVSGVWLEFMVHDSEGQSETYEREIADRVGYAARQTPGTVPFEVGGENEPLISDQSNYTALLAPSAVSTNAINALHPHMLQAVQQGQAAYNTAQAILAAGQEKDPSRLPIVRAAMQDMGLAARTSQAVQLLMFAAASDAGLQQVGSTYLVRPYYDSPRILLAAWERDEARDTNLISMDLRKNDVRTVVYPGQSWEGLMAFNTTRGILEGELETAFLEDIFSQNAVSVSAIFRAVREQDIPLHSIDVTTVDQLTELQISDEAKARIANTLTDAEEGQYLIIVPQQAVQIGDSTMVGWLQVDMINGEVRDVLENGQHFALISYFTPFTKLEDLTLAMIGYFHGFAAQGLAFLGEILARLPLKPCDISDGGGSGPSVDTPPDYYPIGPGANCQGSSLKDVWEESIDEATAKVEHLVSELSAEAKIGKKNFSKVPLPGAKDAAGKIDFIDSYLKGVGFKLGKKIPRKMVKVLGRLGVPKSHRFAGGFLSGATTLNVMIAKDPPLPAMLLNATAQQPILPRAEALLTVNANVPAAPLSGTLTVSNSMITASPGSISFYAPALSGMGLGGNSAS